MLALKFGSITRGDICSDCGSSKGIIVGHHEDYRFPLDVVWLCKSCHKKRHPSKTKLKRGAI